MAATMAPFLSLCPLSSERWPTKAIPPYLDRAVRVIARFSRIKEALHWGSRQLALGFTLAWKKVGIFLKCGGTDCTRNALVLFCWFMHVSPVVINVKH